MDIKKHIDLFSQKVKHFLITHIGKLEKDTNVEEFYFAFCQVLREEIMVNWTSTIESIYKEKPRVLYYISMEYMPGRFLGNNITNISATELVQAVLQRFNRNYYDLQACEFDPGLGNGGLGRLASCFLDSLAAMRYPAMGYGLRYQYGIFEQEIWNGKQVERPDIWLLNENPWEFRRDRDAVSIKFMGHLQAAQNSHGDEVYLLENYDEVRALPYDYPIIGFPNNEDFSVLSLRLWTTKESPRNFELQRYNAGQLDQASENTSITDVLYPSDHHETGKRIRLKQEFLLSSASIQDIIHHHLHVYGDMNLFAEKTRIQINETHAALVIPELMRLLTKNYDFKWNDAWGAIQEICSYTNHTILREALEEWNEHRMAELLPRQYNMIQKINQKLCTDIRKHFSKDENCVKRISIIEEGQIRMANLCIYGSHKVNGVAKLHSKILKERLFNDFYQFYPEKFTNVTNGVTHRRWLLHCNPFLAKFISDRIGTQWISHFDKISELEKFASDKDSQEQLMKIKSHNKNDLLQFLTKENPLRDSKGKIISHTPVLDTSALFDVQIKRFHEYKRQLMNVFHCLMVIQELQKNIHSRNICRFVIFAGKAAPGYENAKRIILLIYAISRWLNEMPEIQQKICLCFVENYNVSHAQTIIPAADLSEQISTAGMEASGTGVMKLAMNGALTIGTHDGANIEMHEAVGDRWWPFGFGHTADEINQMKQEGSYTSKEIYDQDAEIRSTIDLLKNPCLARNDEEKEAFAQLHHSLLENEGHSFGDPFFVLKDLRNFYETQKKVEQLYATPNLWAETVIHNIAKMGIFSTDYSIQAYAEKIWGIHPCHLDLDIQKKVENEYAEAKKIPS